MTVARLRAGLRKHDGGVLKFGSHNEGTQMFCALEFDSVMREREFSDDPKTLPDLRVFNDKFGRGPKADKLRTNALLPVMAAMWDWRKWSESRKTNFLKQAIEAIPKELTFETEHFLDYNARYGTDDLFCAFGNSFYGMSCAKRTVLLQKYCRSLTKIAKTVKASRKKA